MRTYRRSDSHLFCGHWNGSPLEIGFPDGPLLQAPANEVRHFHDYHEYYVVLEGRAELEVEGETVPLHGGTVMMVEPGEKHRIVAVDPQVGARWVVIKERSLPDSKHVAPEESEP